MVYIVLANNEPLFAFANEADAQTFITEYNGLQSLSNLRYVPVQLIK